MRYFRNRMEKLSLFSNGELWMSMRNVHKRIVDDYLPAQTAEMFGLLSSVYGSELGRLATSISASLGD